MYDAISVVPNYFGCGHYGTAGGFACLISRRILSGDLGAVGTTPAHQALRASQ